MRSRNESSNVFKVGYYAALDNEEGLYYVAFLEGEALFTNVKIAFQVQYIGVFYQ